jgi:sarcosine oxidase/L-pipecolate oxidase
VVPDPNLTGSCLQTNVKDNNFVLDFLPEGPDGNSDNNKVVVFCAGW